MLLLSAQLPAVAATIPVKLYKNPNCGCCDVYADHLQANGFKVEMINTRDTTSIKKKFGVAEKLEGCHTAVINGYVFEGLTFKKSNCCATSCNNLRTIAKAANDRTV